MLKYNARNYYGQQIVHVNITVQWLKIALTASIYYIIVSTYNTDLQINICSCVCFSGLYRKKFLSVTIALLCFDRDSESQGLFTYFKRNPICCSWSCVGIYSYMYRNTRTAPSRYNWYFMIIFDLSLRKSDLHYRGYFSVFQEVIWGQPSFDRFEISQWNFIDVV